MYNKEMKIFTDAMIHKLRLNQKKGGWENKSLPELFDKLRGEITELEEAIGGGNYIEILLEAADVANYAMMIAWNVTRGAILGDDNVTD